MRIRVKIDSVRMDGYSIALSRIGGRARPRRGPLAGGWGVAAARGAPAGRQEHGLARAAAAADPMLQQGRGERIGGDLRRGRWVGLGGGTARRRRPAAGRRKGGSVRGGEGEGVGVHIRACLQTPPPPFVLPRAPPPAHRAPRRSTPADGWPARTSGGGVDSLAWGLWSGGGRRGGGGCEHPVGSPLFPDVLAEYRTVQSPREGGHLCCGAGAVGGRPQEPSMPSPRAQGDGCQGFCPPLRAVDSSVTGGGGSSHWDATRTADGMDGWGGAARPRRG